jgi:class 3 adenylate cyclase
MRPNGLQTGVADRNARRFPFASASTLERDTSVAADNRIELRIGIYLGDVIVEGDDLYGDGVNIAARIEALADTGGVFVSNTVTLQNPSKTAFLGGSLCWI